MPTRSLRTDLPYGTGADELPLETSTAPKPLSEAGTDTQVAVPTAPTTGEALTETQVYQDAVNLAQQLYDRLVQQHGSEALTAVVDNDVLSLLSRYRVLQPAPTEVEYYSNAGTFFREATLEVPQEGNLSLPAAAQLIPPLQRAGRLPGLEQGMTWQSGYIRLARFGKRPILLLPRLVEAETSSMDAAE